MPFVRRPQAVQPPGFAFMVFPHYMHFLYHVFRNKTGLLMAVAKRQQLQKDGVSTARAPRVDTLAGGARGAQAAQRVMANSPI